MKNVTNGGGMKVQSLNKKKKALRPILRADKGRGLTPSQKLSQKLAVRKRSTNKRIYRKVRRNTENMGEKNIDKIPFNRPDGLSGVSKISFGLQDKFLNPSEYTTIVPQMPSVQTTLINIPIQQPALTKVSALTAFMAMAQGISVDELITLEDGQSVGLLWFYSACIAYDLWYAMSADFCNFQSAPKWYWDLRSGVTPTKRGGFSYQFITPDTFFGPDGLYPNGFPIIVDDQGVQSLGWRTVTGPLDTIQTVVPTITEADIVANIGSVCSSIWTAMAKMSANTVLVPDPESNNPFSKSVGAFMAYIPEETLDSINNRWSTFSSETPFAPWEEWLGYLGLAGFANAVDIYGNAYTRTGKHVIKEFQFADYLGDRILRGDVGKVPIVYLRKKMISIEWIAGLITTQLINADAFYNNLAGTNSINNANWDKSVLYNLPPSYLVLALMSVLRRWQLINAAYSDNPSSLASLLTGRKFYVGSSGVIELSPLNVKELLADLSPIEKKTGMGCFKTIGVTAAWGSCSMDPTNDGTGDVPFNNFTNLINAMYMTQTPAVQYIMATDNQGMFPYFDLNTIGTANFTGTSVADGEAGITSAYGILQGNLDCGNTSASTNHSTLLYYTLLLNLPTTDSKKKFKGQSKFKIEKKDKSVEFSIANWTLTYGSTFNQLNNCYSFSNDLVSYDMSRGMCISFEAPPFHTAIYKEPNYLLYDTGEMRLFSLSVINGAKSFAHPIATNGGYEPTTMMQNCVTQNLGGGFGSLAKGLLGKIPIVGGLLGDLAEGILGDD